MQGGASQQVQVGTIRLRRSTATGNRANNVDEPRELPIKLSQQVLVGGARGNDLLQPGGEWIEQRYDVFAARRVGAARDRWQVLEMLLGDLLVLERILDRIVGHAGGHRLEPRDDVRLEDLRYELGHVVRRAGPHERQAAHEARPRAQQIEGAVGRPLPSVQRLDREVAHHRDPLKVAVGLDQEVELEVGTKPSKQPTELMVARLVLKVYTHTSNLINACSTIKDTARRGASLGSVAIVLVWPRRISAIPVMSCVRNTMRPLSEVKIDLRVDDNSTKLSMAIDACCG